MSFAQELARFAKKSRRNVQTVQRRVALDVFRRVIFRTPVDTGRARGNWQTALGLMPVGTVERNDKGPVNQAGVGSGAAASEASRVILRSRPGQAIWLANHLPYIRRLEYEGWSKQAPSGMVRVTLTEFKGLVNVHGGAVAQGVGADA